MIIIFDRLSFTSLQSFIDYRQTKMKIFVACFLMAALGLAFAKSQFPKEKLNMLPMKSEEESALKQTVVSSENDQDTEDDDYGDDDIATFQGIFNVLSLAEVESAKAMQEKKATAQLFGSILKLVWKLGKSLLKVGKHFLKKTYCPKEPDMKAILQELIGEQGNSDEDNVNTKDEDAKAFVELQSLFNTLRKAEAMVMQYDSTGDNYAKAEEWWNKVKHWINKHVGGLTRKYLCKE